MNMDTELEQLSASWDAKAEEWHRQVGAEGDANRRLNSDPVLWRMLGDVAGLDVLDAGCGTGYLLLKLMEKGARAVGVDVSAGMAAVARRDAAARGADADVRVADCAALNGIGDASIDRVVSNYVLMDLPDMRGAVREFHRVLRPNGSAVLIFSHPCFSPPDNGFSRLPDGRAVFRWGRPYFDEYEYREEWGHFTSPFICYHRPLSEYWRAFTGTGFEIVEFCEPTVEPVPGAEIDPQTLNRLRMMPNSVAFHLRKPGR
ncbi:MAG: methyltransferase domain-containing protein [Bacteroidetes bacterium]|nr:methyltransferase domain-containing protein [Bacteroidota bacterium]